MSNGIVLPRHRKLLNASFPERGNLTKPRQRVLKELSRRGGKASNYELAYPRSNMMHTLLMAGLVTIEGPTDAWGDPDSDGFWVLTEAGRAALSGSKE